MTGKLTTIKAYVTEIETCERCGYVIEEDTTEWYEAHDEEFEHEHHVYDMQVEAVLETYD